MKTPRSYNVSTMTVGIRDLRLHFSQYLARVRRGETIVVTDRGRPIARLGPSFPTDLPPGLKELVDTGRATYDPTAVRYVPTPIRMVPGGKTAVDYVADQRR